MAWNSPASAHDPCSWAASRLVPRRRASSATRITPSSTGPTSAPSFARSMAFCRMPRAIDDSAIAPRFVMLPMTSAASARRRIDHVNRPPGGRPVTPAWRNTPRNAITAAMTHTWVWSRRTGMPSIDARSGADAAALIATPVSVVRRKAVRPMRMIGATIAAIRSLASKRTAPIVRRNVNGGSNVRMVGVRCQICGNIAAPKNRNCPTPIVATVTIRRGALKNRRMNASSTIAPTRAAARATHQRHPVGESPDLHHDDGGGRRQGAEVRLAKLTTLFAR